MSIRQRETIKDLKAELEAANDEIRSLRKQQSDAKDLQAQADRLHKFVKDLFYLHPPLKKAYYGEKLAANLLYSLFEPKYEYVARLAEAKRNVKTLSSAELTKIDRYLETVLEEDEA